MGTPIKLKVDHTGEYIINPTIEELEESELDLVMAGTADAVEQVGHAAPSVRNAVS